MHRLDRKLGVSGFELKLSNPSSTMQPLVLTTTLALMRDKRYPGFSPGQDPDGLSGPFRLRFKSEDIGLVPVKGEGIARSRCPCRSSCFGHNDEPRCFERPRNPLAGNRGLGGQPAAIEEVRARGQRRSRQATVRCNVCCSSSLAACTVSRWFYTLQRVPPFHPSRKPHSLLYQVFTRRQLYFQSRAARRH